jgi:hypothetical protein
VAWVPEYAPLKKKGCTLMTILLPFAVMKTVETNVAELVDDGDYGRINTT